MQPTLSLLSTAPNFGPCFVAIADCLLTPTAMNSTQLHPSKEISFCTWYGLNWHPAKNQCVFC